MKKATNTTGRKLNDKASKLEVELGEMTDGLVEVTVTINGTVAHTGHLPLNGGKLTIPFPDNSSQVSPSPTASASQNDSKAQQRQRTKDDVSRKRKQLMKKRDRDGLR